jgi:3',5'-cyclic AMP phosphodiesterase CpdA
MLPIVQIVHVSDLHFRHPKASAYRKLNAKRRTAQRALQYLIEKHDWFDWNEGTQGHYACAPDAFQYFLEQWRKEDDRWYGNSDNSAQTWLVDTGDLTAFGDGDSISLGFSHLERWRTALGGCKARFIYGNHDAWPEMQPVHALLGFSRTEIDRQREKVRSREAWRARDWVEQPLTIRIPSLTLQDAQISLYGLDSVSWSALGNVRAIGELTGADVDAYRERVRKEHHAPTYRIVAMHHPLVFPYERHEIHTNFLIPTMALKSGERWAAILRNDKSDPPGIGPLANLFLSGHTHESYPAGLLPKDASEIYQGMLDRTQLQLVGGSLMLNRGFSSLLHDSKARHLEDRARRHFTPALVDRRNCQAQILRFFADSSKPYRLVMQRIPIHSPDGTEYFAAVDESCQVTVSYC